MLLQLYRTYCSVIWIRLPELSNVDALNRTTIKNVAHCDHMTVTLSLFSIKIQL